MSGIVIKRLALSGVGTKQRDIGAVKDDDRQVIRTPDRRDRRHPCRALHDRIAGVASTTDEVRLMLHKHCEKAPRGPA